MLRLPGSLSNMFHPLISNVQPQLLEKSLQMASTGAPDPTNPLHHHQYANINQGRAYHIPPTFSGPFILADTCMLYTESQP